MVDESVSAVVRSYPPSHVIQHIGSPVATSSNLHADTDMMPIKERENRFNASVMTGRCGGDEAEKNPNSIVVGITVDDAFCAVASLLRGGAGTRQGRRIGGRNLEKGLPG